MARIRSAQPSKQQTRGRKPKKLSKLSQEFRCIISGKKCDSKSFAESKRNTLLLRLIKSKIYESIIKGSLNPLESREDMKSNERSRFLAKCLEQNPALSYKIKSEFLRIQRWEEELLGWLRIQYCGNENPSVVMKLLLDLIFEYLGLSEEIEMKIEKELRIEQETWSVKMFRFDRDERFNEAESLDMIEPIYGRDEEENNRNYDGDNFLNLSEDEIENNRMQDDLNSTEFNGFQEI